MTDLTNKWNALYSSNGRFDIRKLFFETGGREARKSYPPIFTLKPYDYNGLPSAYLIYMDSIDEYDAATKLVPNMKIWDELKSANWFLTDKNQWNFEGLETWREHMKQRDASRAKAALFAKIEAGDVTASKAILAETKTKSNAGRKNNKNKPQLASVKRIEEFKNKIKKKVNK